MYQVLQSDHIIFNKENFVGKKQGLLTDYYEVIRKLGKGSYGKVYEVKNKTTGEIRACKQLSKSNLSNLKKFEKEIELLIKTDHPNIIKLYEVFEDDRFIYLIMEKCNGGELFDRIIIHIQSNKMYTEKDAAKIFQQLISAIVYCHDNGIVHRDLKPENLLYINEGDEINNPIKVIDFGLSRNFDPKSKMNTKVGTAYYVAPEVLEGNYTEKCDVWSAGVILYILLSGEPPFNGANDREIYKAISKMIYQFPYNKWKKISKNAIDLIEKCLVPEDKRISAKEVLEHPWFKKIDNEENADIQIDLPSFKDYVNSCKLKKMTLTYIASRLNENDVSNLREIFTSFDKNKDGHISLEELKNGLEKLNGKEIDNQEIEKIFLSLDTDKNGQIGYTEFLASIINERTYLNEERLYEAFVNLDKNGSGKISKDEIKTVIMKNNANDNCVEKIIEKVDKNGDGVIDYNEFLDMMGYNRMKMD
jgi:calcium-dependent protein kinase